MARNEDQLALLGGPRAITTAHTKWPIIDADDKAAVMAVLERGVLSGPFAPEVRALEREFAEYLGAKHCLTTNSGTAALHIALAAAGVGPGDEVITSAFSFVATALAVLHHSAIPVFVDIEPETFGLDPKLLAAAITPRTKAIMPVHIHGTACRIDEIKRIADAHGIPVIEDAAQAHGATSRGRKLGTIGASSGFSIQASKNLSAGEGGLFVTNDDELMARANRARMFGEDIKASDAASYDIERPLDGNRAYDSLGMGWMYRTTELTAALARSQLRKLDAFNAQATRNAAVLRARLGVLEGVRLPVPAEDGVSAIHKYRVRLTVPGVAPRKVRDAMIKGLVAEGADAVMWQSKPVPGQRLFQDKIGYGGGWPWSGGRPVSYELDQYPETNKLLDDSIVLFSHTHPIAAQSTATAEAYADAFVKVWSRIEEIARS